MDSATQLTLLLHVGATLAMTGLIWFVQIVHYPLFASVPPDAFQHYESLHMRYTGWVVGPLMLLELGTQIILLLRPPSPNLDPLLWSGAALLLIIWISTALIQVRLHIRLRTGFNKRNHRALVQTNWVRTAAWTARAILVLLLLHVLLTNRH